MIVFTPEQIKSAMDNSWTFGTDNADIRFSVSVRDGGRDIVWPSTNAALDRLVEGKDAVLDTSIGNVEFHFGRLALIV